MKKKTERRKNKSKEAAIPSLLTRGKIKIKNYAEVEQEK